MKYIVKSGDTLSKIAKEVYGDAKRWREILEANKAKIKDPDVILPGSELVIPGTAGKGGGRGVGADHEIT